MKELKEIFKAIKTQINAMTTLQTIFLYFLVATEVLVIIGELFSPNSMAYFVYVVFGETLDLMVFASLMIVWNITDGFRANPIEEKPKKPFQNPQIICAANRVTDVDGTKHIVLGVRHWDGIMRRNADKMGLDDACCGNAEQGFIDTHGVYHDRVSALALVKSSGQPFDADRNGADDELYSEGIC